MRKRVAHHAVGQRPLAGQEPGALFQVGLDHGDDRSVVVQVAAHFRGDLRQPRQARRFAAPVSGDDLIAARAPGTDDDAAQHAIGAHALYKFLHRRVTHDLERVSREGVQLGQGDVCALSGSLPRLGYSFRFLMVAHGMT